MILIWLIVTIVLYLVAAYLIGAGWVMDGNEWGYSLIVCFLWPISITVGIILGFIYIAYSLGRETKKRETKK